MIYQNRRWSTFSNQVTGLMSQGTSKPTGGTLGQIIIKGATFVWPPALSCLLAESGSSLDYLSFILLLSLEMSYLYYEASLYQNNPFVI